MIPSRFRTVLSVVLHNLASYSHQAIQRFVQASTGFVLQALSDISELSYSFFCSHCEAYKRKIADRASRTSYIKDINGMRRKVVSPPTREFRAINYRPPLRRLFRRL
ncbi:MAG: hypothetical protein RBR05_04640 [Candidatus Methanomethylophilaceae archaeon]|nr:hypothetical protein [Candidatus Methanomethylophilaceae archaeon]